MLLTLVRHAQPAYVSDGRSWVDPPLTDEGRRQAELLGERALAWEVDAIWVSPMVRAQQTCAPVAAALGLVPIQMDWLAEIQNPPQWDGSPADEIEEFFATSLDRSIDEMWEGAPGGESFWAFHERVRHGLHRSLGVEGLTPSEDGLWDGSSDRRVVVVAHAGTNAVILGLLLGIDPVPWEWDRFTHVHSGVSRLVTQRTAGRQSWSLRSLSDRSHLPRELVSG